MARRHSHGPLQPECPRCGYDLSGIAAAWADACSLEGTCSECGLAFAWCDVLIPSRLLPAWSFEHARDRLPIAALRTYGVALRPWMFWGGLKMHHPLVGGRLAAMAPLAAIVTVALFALWTFGCDVLTSGRLDSPASVGFWRYGSFATSEFGPYWSVWFTLASVWIMLVPLGFVLLPQTLRQAKVRREHLLRAVVYSVIGAMFIAGALRGSLALARVVEWRILGRPWWQSGWRTGPVEALVTSVIRWMYRGPCWPVGLSLLAAWLALWWFWTARRYLRLPHAAGVTAALLVLSAILAFALVLFFPGSQFSWQLI